MGVRHGGPGSTIDFWLMPSFTRLTLGVKMHPTAAFLSSQMHRALLLEEQPPEVSTMEAKEDILCSSLCLPGKCQMLGSSMQRYYDQK